jgi:hypothetical protein
MESDSLDRYLPAPDQRPIEAIISTNIAKRAVVVAPVLALVFWITSGWEGAVASLIGVAVVVLNFLLAGYVLSYAARISLSLYQAAVLFGFLIRLGLITVSLLLIGGVTDIDRMALGISVVVSYLVLLSWEAIAVVNGKERDLEWSS